MYDEDRKITKDSLFTIQRGKCDNPNLSPHVFCSFFLINKMAFVCFNAGPLNSQLVDSVSHVTTGAASNLGPYWLL